MKLVLENSQNQTLCLKIGQTSDGSVYLSGIRNNLEFYLAWIEENGNIYLIPRGCVNAGLNIVQEPPF